MEDYALLAQELKAYGITPGNIVKIIMQSKRLDKASLITWVRMNYNISDQNLVAHIAAYAKGRSSQDTWAEKVVNYADTRWLRYTLWLLGASQASIGTVTGKVNRATVNDSINKCAPITEPKSRMEFRKRLQYELIGPNGISSLEQLSEYVEAYIEYRDGGGSLPQNEKDAVQLMIQLRSARVREEPISSDVEDIYSASSPDERAAIQRKAFDEMFARNIDK